MGGGGDPWGGMMDLNQPDHTYNITSHENFLDFSDYQWSAGKLIQQLTIQFWSMIS